MGKTSIGKKQSILNKPNPLEATSVATKMGALPFLNSAQQKMDKIILLTSIEVLKVCQKYTFTKQYEERVVSLWSLLDEPFKIASQYVQDAQSLLHNLQQLLKACFYLKSVLRKTVFLLFSSSEHTQDQAQGRAASA